MSAVATKIINYRLGVAANWLAQQDIASMSSLRQMEHRGRIVALNRGGRGVEKVYEYSTLPECLKRKIDACVNVYEESRRNLIEQHIVHDAAIRDWFDNYKTSRGSSLPNSKDKPIRTIYYNNAVILNAIVALVQKIQKRGDRVDWEMMAEYVATLDRMTYNFELPENSRKLHEKVKNYLRDGLESLVHKNYKTGLANAAKIVGEEQRSMLIALIAEHRNFDYQEIANLYNEWAAAHGWKTISRSTVQEVARKATFITAASKHGAENFRSTLSYQVKRSAPSAAMYMWVLDGWDAEIAYKKSDGKRTTYYNRLTLEVVLDASTRMPVGYAVGESENAELIREALRNAERFVEETTGTMLMPHQIQCDNFAKSAMWNTYSALAQYVTPARVGNAKAKIIEPWFCHFNDKYCKYAFNWTGHGTTARKKNQPNLNITLKNKQNIPTLEELIVEINALMARYRQQALPAYREAMAALPAGERRVLGMKQYLALFGENTGYQYQLQGTGINVRILGKKHQYDLLPASDSEADMREALRFREMCWERWTVLLDPLDERHILVENKNKTEQFLLTLKDEQPMALKDRKPGDYERLAAIWKFNRAIEAHVTRTICDHQQRAIEQVSNERRDYEMLSKALITDSQGQHKLPKAAARLAAAEPVDAFEAAKTNNDESIYDQY